MSRSRKVLDMQNKHLTNTEIAEKEDIENVLITIGNDQLKEPPSWLIDDIAEEEWSRIYKEIDKIKALGNLDLNNIGGYCNSYSLYRKATKELENKELVSKKMTPKGIVIIKNPLIEIQKNYAEEMRKFASLCGMTIDSRLKAATMTTTAEQNNISNEFGDI